MMFDQFLKETAELIAQGESFVTATVVRACHPLPANRETRQSFMRTAGYRDGLAAGARNRWW